MRRVVVTGMGAITPIGLSVDEFWNSVKENTVGIDNITRFDTTDYKVKLAAEVRIMMLRIIWILRQLKGWKSSASMLLRPRMRL
mgnify:CR=1 FL=1